MGSFVMRHIFAALIAVAILLTSQTTTKAATITWLPDLHGFSVSGRIEAGDEAKFRQAIGDTKEATIYLKGPGGNLMAGMEIGDLIHYKHFTTAVPEGAICASSCAYAWLAGEIGYMGQTSRLGFHGASVRAGGSVQDTSGGNALIGAYLSKLGLPYETIFYLTSTPYSSIMWLSRAEASANGIPARDISQVPYAPPPSEIAGHKAIGIAGVGTRSASMRLIERGMPRAVSADCFSGDLHDLYGRNIRFDWLTAGKPAPRFVANQRTVFADGEPDFEIARAQLAALCPGYGRIIVP